jgi:hypothetical protein
MGRVLTFDLAMRTAPGQLPKDFAKFLSSGCHVVLCRAGDADEVKR